MALIALIIGSLCLGFAAILFSGVTHCDDCE